MYFRFNPFVSTACAVMLFAAPAFSQYQTDGNVKDADGKPVAGAIIALESDGGAHYKVKTDKKGHYVLLLVPGVYAVVTTVDGQIRDKRAAKLPQPESLDITLRPLAANAPMTAAPAAAPEAAPQKGQPKGDDKAAKEREAQLAKNKELNDSFAAGKAAIDNKQWDEAITQLTKASELGPTQTAVWASLADAYASKAKAAKSADAAPIFAKSYESFEKLLAIKPDDAGTYNNYALALAAGGKLDDAKTKLAKAVELDPPGAGRYHYNLGALLMNSNQTDGAIDEFKKAIDADPNYAEAYYYYGSTSAGKTTLDKASGKMVPPPGTIEALQKYLTLKPDGPNAESAKALIAAVGSSVAVEYKDPNAPAAKTTKKSK